MNGTGSEIRRRRECGGGHRFTTYERSEVCLTTPEAAKKLGISRHAMWALAEAGVVRPFNRDREKNGRMKFSIEEIERFEATRNVR